MNDHPKATRPSFWEWLAPVGLGVAVLVAWFGLPPLPQSPAYHRFADRRTLLDVPHFWNVVSNLPFVLVGAAGLWVVLRHGARLFLDPREKWPFLVVFLGVFLTGFGSSYYHWAPTNERLLWDRLPMSIAFMGLFAAILGERTRPQVALVLLGPLLLLGTGTVLLWYVGELHGAGNLRPYLAVQFYPLGAIPLLLLFAPARYTHGGDWIISLAWYGLAKGLEEIDARIFDGLGGVGGHPLKHLAAGVGAFWILRMVALRQPLRPSS